MAACRPLLLLPLLLGLSHALLYGPVSPRTWSWNPNIRHDPRPIFGYAASNDPAYGWEQLSTTYQVSSPCNWTGYVLNLTSQNWLTPADVDRTLWFHTLVVIVPDDVNFVADDYMNLYITGENVGDIPTPSDDDMTNMAQVSCQAGLPTAVLYQVPCSPIVFASDPSHQPRIEDELLAWSWYNFIQNTSRPELIGELAMAKSAVAALDALQDFWTQMGLGTLERFNVAGGSKRGWTTWLTCAIDERCASAIPIVFDLLNLNDNLIHMYEAYGGYTWVFSAYYDINLTSLINEPMMAAIQAVVDPLQYSEYLVMPKMVTDATGDEFFLPDDDAAWWGKLPGECFRLMVPNAEHSMVTGLGTALPAAAAFIQSAATGAARPAFSWTIDQGESPDPYGTGRITLTTAEQPTEVIMWTATTFDGSRRDFRLIKGITSADPCDFIPIGNGAACFNPVLWYPETITGSVVDGAWVFVAEQPLPEIGWRGFFLEVHFPPPSDGALEYIFTTQVSIIPQSYPFEPCGSGAACRGVLV